MTPGHGGPRNPIRRVEVRLPVEGLAGSIEVDFFSDLHVRSQDDLEEILEAAEAPRARMLLMGGDYVEKIRFLDPLFDRLSPLYETVLAVVGNNDLVFEKALALAAERNGARLLRDEVARLGPLSVLGTSDPVYKRPSLPPLPPAPLLVLSHSPDILIDLPPAAPLSLLTGHVHGGQVRFSFWPWWWTHTRVGRAHGEGHSRRGRQHVFTGRGTGTSLLPIRNVPRELYTVTLVPA